MKILKLVKWASFVIMLLSGVSCIWNGLIPWAIGGFSFGEAGAIGIIGGADGPTAIFTTTKIAPHVIYRIVIFILSSLAWLLLKHKTKE